MAVLMPTPLLICVKALNGGVFVALFAVLGEMMQPKRFAGIFGASPAVALANLIVIALAQGDASARGAATGMIAGAVALAAACAAAIPAVRRWGAIRGSALLWGVWILVGVAAAVPLTTATTGTGSARFAAGFPAGGRARRGDKGGRSTGPGGGRLFTVDFAALREIPPDALALRFAFGAGVSIVAGLIGVAAGKRAGGAMLAAPAVLSATLTIIEKREGRGAAVTEVQGSGPGAVALIGFAVVAATSTARLPLAVALLCALATWVAAAIGGYLAQATILPSWRRDAGDLARRRRDAARIRRRH
ncbi:MAG TPA: hypothetical protein VF482_05720, partial [Trebonia sp.]